MQGSGSTDEELDRETSRPLSPATQTTYQVTSKPGLEEEKVSFKHGSFHQKRLERIRSPIGHTKDEKRKLHASAAHDV